MRERALYYVIGILILAFIVLANKTYKSYREKVLKEKVRWCVSSNPNAISFEDRQSELKLRDSLLNLQANLSLDKQYKITEDEYGFVVEIIRSYQNDLVQKFFNGFALNFRDLSEREYFFVTLGAFLEKHNLDITFNDKKMYAIKNQKYGSGVIGWVSATYELTDYAIIYYKVYYTVLLECNLVHGKSIGVDSVAQITLDNIKKAIDIREVEVSKM